MMNYLTKASIKENSNLSNHVNRADIMFYILICIKRKCSFVYINVGEWNTTTIKIELLENIKTILK